jgi:hypothetical protein
VKSEVNVRLAVTTDKEVGLVDQLLADTNVALEDENAGVVDGLGVVHLVNPGLEAALEETLSGKTEDVIEALLILSEDAVANKAPEEGVTLEKPLGVLLVKSKQLTGSGTDLGKGKLGAPDLTLAAETVLAEQLHLLIETLLLIGAPRGLGGLSIVPVAAALGHFVCVRSLLKTAEIKKKENGVEGKRCSSKK